MVFSEESLSSSLEEAKPLLQKHWEEISYYKDITLNPDYDAYSKLESMGCLKVFIARDTDHKMAGYAVFMIRNHLHYKQSLMAVQDIVFMDPERRGMGLLFIKWCDNRLRDIGIQVVSHHIKASHNFGPAMEKLGYELQDLIYTKRLDK